MQAVNQFLCFRARGCKISVTLWNRVHTGTQGRLSPIDSVERPKCHNTSMKRELKNMRCISVKLQWRAAILFSPYTKKQHGGSCRKRLWRCSRWCSVFSLNVNGSCEKTESSSERILINTKAFAEVVPRCHTSVSRTGAPSVTCRSLGWMWILQFYSNVYFSIPHTLFCSCKYSTCTHPNQNAISSSWIIIIINYNSQF